MSQFALFYRNSGVIFEIAKGKSEEAVLADRGANIGARILTRGRLPDGHKPKLDRSVVGNVTVASKYRFKNTVTGDVTERLWDGERASWPFSDPQSFYQFEKV